MQKKLHDLAVSQTHGHTRKPWETKSIFMEASYNTYMFIPTERSRERGREIRARERGREISARERGGEIRARERGGERLEPGREGERD